MGIVFKKIVTEEKVVKDGVEYTVVLKDGVRTLVPTSELPVTQKEEDTSDENQFTIFPLTFLKPGNYDISGI